MKFFLLLLAWVIAIAFIPIWIVQAQSNCDRAYPSLCIPSPPPDLDCKSIADRNFPVRPPDPHRFDGDRDGIGCESSR
ncbi:MAG: calcium-binding protein with excalibur domain protein [Drouetiella hepatica Uher 2000/2452]|jgi:hypothetical protein|uniref:Calcium-binding protein with excalibur domain protein n=1 Tax=Drouetiella hepatica Uher 2000/2452 TaxID=904376 RepID=A0A951UNT8_9CYAN|nr:calcium-binding protein with excalibur domain protein [Drouetiella hepatica Uher 2000/2452]